MTCGVRTARAPDHDTMVSGVDDTRVNGASPFADIDRGRDAVRSCGCHRQVVRAHQHPGLMDIHDANDLVVDRYRPVFPALRIGVVTETWPPEVNGVALTVARIVEGLQRRGHDVQLVRPRQGDGDRGGTNARCTETLTGGLPIPRYPQMRMGMPSMRMLMRLWTRERPDVVHIATEGPLGWSALRAARKLGLPVSSDFRTNFHAYSGHYGVGWLRKPIVGYLRKFHNGTDCTMVPTDRLRRDLEELGLRNLTVVARGVDTGRFGPEHRSAALRAQWGVAPDEIAVLCVGRLAPEKNLDLVLASFAAIRRVRPQARLVLVGDGPMRAELRLRAPDAVLAGQRGGADLAVHYASADLFLFPSVTETFGNVTIEAMASGLAVVAFDYAAAGQLIRSGENGVLAPFGHGGLFIERALEVATDADFRDRLRGLARVSAAASGWDGIVEKFEGVLRGVIRTATVAGERREGSVLTRAA